jgi:hypothetical protein
MSVSSDARVRNGRRNAGTGEGRETVARLAGAHFRERLEAEHHRGRGSA